MANPTIHAPVPEIPWRILPAYTAQMDSVVATRRVPARQPKRAIRRGIFRLCVLSAKCPIIGAEGTEMRPRMKRSSVVKRWVYAGFKDRRCSIM